MLAILSLCAKGARADPSRTDITLLRYKPAPRRLHIYAEMISLGEDLHAQQVCPSPPGIEIKRPF